MDYSLSISEKIFDDNYGLIPENIKKDAVVYGVRGTYEGGGTKKGLYLVPEQNITKINIPNEEQTERFKQIAEAGEATDYSFNYLLLNANLEIKTENQSGSAPIPGIIKIDPNLEIFTVNGDRQPFDYLDEYFKMGYATIHFFNSVYDSLETVKWLQEIFGITYEEI